MTDEREVTMDVLLAISMLANAWFLMDGLSAADMPGRSYLSFIATVACALSLGFRLGAVSV